MSHNGNTADSKPPDGDAVQRPAHQTPESRAVTEADDAPRPFEADSERSLEADSVEDGGGAQPKAASEPTERRPERHRRRHEQRRGGHEVCAALVRFRIPGHFAEFDATGVDLCRADKVVVEAERGQSIGTIVEPPRKRRSKRQLRRILRVVNDDDEKVISRNRVREREAFHFCIERIKARRLPMKLVSVELAHSGTRAVFYFSSSDRVDFRALVKDLARRFHTRIEMRQIGVRDAARHTGGTGICGRELCCATWLPTFKPISIRMAKDQNLSLNHQKLSGLCGRLRCCLEYEQELYQRQRKGLPKLGKRVVTPEGEGRVKDVNVLKRRVRVQLSEGTYAEFDASDISRAGDVRHATPAFPSPEEGEITDAEPQAADAPETSEAPAGEQPKTGKRRRRRRGRRRRGKGRSKGGVDQGGTASQ